MEKQNFEEHIELSKHIRRMALTGSTGTGTEWCDFLNEINIALSVNKESIIKKLEDRRKKAFYNEFHKKENAEILSAIDIINRLLPPIENK